jgi:hypothetical protein
MKGLEDPAILEWCRLLAIPLSVLAFVSVLIGARRNAKRKAQRDSN